jgi:small-conductance mechanosensitive channel
MEAILARLYSYPFLETQLGSWSIALAFAILFWGLSRVTLQFLANRLHKLSEGTKNSWDNVATDVVRATRNWVLLAVGLAIGATLTRLTPDVTHPMFRVIRVILVLQLGIWLHVAHRGLVRIWNARAGEGTPATAASAVDFVGRLIIWSVILLLALPSMGVKVNTLLAGFGVGGVVAALAVQSVLSDAFSAIFLYTDRPFDIGDFIVVGQDKGTVKNIGWRTTRIAAQGGQEIILSNSDLARSRIENYRRMQERRVAFDVGIEYGTPTELVEVIPVLIKTAIEGHPKARFERSHFRELGDVALVFETVFFVLSADYIEYMEVRHSIMLTLLKAFREKGIRFAFPTQTLHVASAPFPMAS